jgi:hypothetical protein
MVLLQVQVHRPVNCNLLLDQRTKAQWQISTRDWSRRDCQATRSRRRRHPHRRPRPWCGKAGLVTHILTRRPPAIILITTIITILWLCSSFTTLDPTCYATWCPASTLSQSMPSLLSTLTPPFPSLQSLRNLSAMGNRPPRSWNGIMRAPIRKILVSGFSTETVW